MEKEKEEKQKVVWNKKNIFLLVTAGICGLGAIFFIVAFILECTAGEPHGIAMTLVLLAVCVGVGLPMALDVLRPKKEEAAEE